MSHTTVPPNSSKCVNCFAFTTRTRSEISVHTPRTNYRTENYTHAIPAATMHSAGGWVALELVGWTSGRTWAQGGAGYWLDRECMAAVAASRLLPPEHSQEDCMVGATLAMLGIYPEHDERYQTGYTGSMQHPLYSNSIISTHYLHAAGMHRVHREWLASHVLAL